MENILKYFPENWLVRDLLDEYASNILKSQISSLYNNSPNTYIKMGKISLLRTKNNKISISIFFILN